MNQALLVANLRIWNGSSWTNTADHLNTARTQTAALGGTGIQSDAFVLVGIYSNARCKRSQTLKTGMVVEWVPLIAHLSGGK